MTSGIKDKILIVGVILMALFSVYKYHQSLINKINDQQTTIINLNVEMSNLVTSNKTLESSVLQLQEQIELERQMCEVRTAGVADYNYNTVNTEAKKEEDKKKTTVKIANISKDTTLSEEKKKERILNAEYDLLAGLVD